MARLYHRISDVSSDVRLCFMKILKITKEITLLSYKPLCSQGVLRPPLGLHVPDLGDEVLPEMGRSLEMETSGASQEVCLHGGRAP